MPIVRLDEFLAWSILRSRDTQADALSEKFLAGHEEASADGNAPVSIFLTILRKAPGTCIAFSVNVVGLQIDMAEPEQAAGVYR